MAPQGRGLTLRDFRPRFTRQRIVGSYILDFYCGAAKLAVELDGSQHYESEAIEYDKTRTRSMRLLGQPPPSADGTPFESKGALGGHSPTAQVYSFPKANSRSMDFYLKRP